MPQEDKEKKEELFPYLALWVGGQGGNSPVAFFDPECEKLAKGFAEHFWPKNHIFGKVMLPKRHLVTRDSIKSIKQFGINLLTKLAEKEVKDGGSSKT